MRISVDVHELPLHLRHSMTHYGLRATGILVFKTVLGVISGTTKINFRLNRKPSKRIFSDRTSHFSDIPVIPSAPRGWWNVISHLISSRAKLQRDVINSHESRFVSDALDRLRRLSERSGNKPDLARVTIVIPAYENVHEVIVCIESLYSFRSSSHFKILVADDCSPTRRFDFLDSVVGVETLRQKVNLGYIGNTNAAVQSVTTEYVMLLNQDTIVLPGLLDQLIEKLDASPQVGIVGPTVLSPTFDVQEAGGIVFREAHAANRGRGLSCNDPTISFSTRVDYISGCCLLTRVDLWRRLNGLNEFLSPAFYDDTDFCLRSSNLSCDSWLVATAYIVHFEGTSMGRNEFDKRQKKHHQVLNRAKVADLHPRLKTHTDKSQVPWPNSHTDSRKKVVCLFSSPPKPTIDGGSVDFDLFVRYLMLDGFRVTAVFTERFSLEETLNWRQLGCECRSWNDMGTEALEGAVLLLSFGIGAGLHAQSQAIGNLPWIHYSSDVVTRRRISMIEAPATNRLPESETRRRWYTDLPLDPQRLWEIEQRLFSRTSCVVFVSQDDLVFSRSHGYRGPAEVIPILRGHDSEKVPISLTSGHAISFVGSFNHAPNPDAIEYFLQEIWPTIIRRHPNTEFHIWGSNYPKPFISFCESHLNVRVCGWFASYDQVARNSRVLVSPLRFGAGMKGKVLTSMVHSLPVIGTPISFEGINTDHFKSIACGESPDQLVSLIAEAMESNDRLLNLKRLQYQSVIEEHTPDREQKRVRQLVANFIQG